jgi:hypothetical protein
MRHILLLTCCLLAANIVTAQFSIYASGGLSGLNYKPEGGSQSVGTGFGGGVGYSFKIGARQSPWKIGTGIEFSTFTGKVSFDRLSESYEHGTGVDKSLFSYSLNDYSEQQSVALFSVPAMLQYETGYIVRFCLSGGVKFGLPISAKTKINPGTVIASGNYEYENQIYADLPQHGFPEGTKLQETQSKIDLGISTSLSLETGLFVKKFYAGVYFDYGLNNMQKTGDKHVVEYRDSYSFVHNSILNTELVDKINIYSAGLKLKIQF